MIFVLQKCVFFKPYPIFDRKHLSLWKVLMSSIIDSSFCSYSEFAIIALFRCYILCIGNACSRRMAASLPLHAKCIKCVVMDAILHACTSHQNFYIWWPACTLTKQACRIIPATHVTTLRLLMPIGQRVTLPFAMHVTTHNNVWIGLISQLCFYDDHIAISLLIYAKHFYSTISCDQNPTPHITSGLL